MRTLTVSRFSCISEATLPIAPITLLIGPQASGKSVLCKLCHFCCGLLNEQVQSISELASASDYADVICDKFLRWFPVETWGGEQFEIRFSFGEHEIKIRRSLSKKRPGKTVRVTLCKSLLAHYENSLVRMKEAMADKAKAHENIDISSEHWQVRRFIREELSRLLGADFVSSQLFIPAGRSFFTSIGKAIAAFEKSTLLDPVTLDFGNIYYGAIRFLHFHPSQDKEIAALIAKTKSRMLGGHLLRERDREVVKTSDGRMIPLSTLSSGQQEIFPLLQVLPLTFAKEYKRIIYVEEPEAHLFPDAQSELIELLSTLVNLYKKSASMVITTHSPYVLSKFNNLLKAGQVGSSRSKAARVGEITRRNSWIPKGDLRAFAICDGKLLNIIDPDGLINGDYLDQISNGIANEFSQLLGVEFAKS
ncbi:MAG TPA: ATP-binding protein [Acidobacteriaceae bacterium]